MASEDAIYRAAFNAAMVKFQERADREIAEPFAVDAARAAAAHIVEGIVLRAVDDAKREAPAKHEPNPLRQCPICAGPAASFSYKSRWCALCEGCRQCWKLITDSTRATTLSHDRQIQEKLEAGGFLWLSQSYQVPSS